MRLIARVFLLWGLILNLGCQANLAENQTQLEANATMEAISPTQGDITMTPVLPTPAHVGLQALIEKAKDDLAERRSVSVNDIVILQAESVTWPDGSLGCPQPGMEYAQVLTPGYLIRLSHGDREFEYHASRGTTVIYCENPSPPVPGTPADT